MQHAVMTGPIRGSVTLADGTVVDCRPDVVYVDTLEQAQELAGLIGDHYADRGHPLHDDGDAFVHDRKQSEKSFAAHAKHLKGEAK